MFSSKSLIGLKNDFRKLTQFVLLKNFSVLFINNGLKI